MTSRVVISGDAVARPARRAIPGIAILRVAIVRVAILGVRR
jgi:hypothetical protein